MKSSLTPSIFFSRLKLEALDSSTANYIREEIIPSQNLDIAESSEVLDQIIETIRDNFPEALADMPKDIKEEQVEEVVTPKETVKVEETEAPKILKHVRLTNHINAFKSILPLKTGDEKKKIQGYINAFKVTLSITPKDVYADGGTIHDNNYTVLYVKEGKVAEKHFHTKGDASEFAKKHKSKAFKFSSGGKVYATYGKHGYKVYKDGTELENVTSDGVDIETIRGNAQERVIHLANQHGATMGGALSEYEDGGEVGGFKVGDKVEIIAGYDGYIGMEGEIIDFNEHQEPNVKTDSHPDGITCRLEDIKHIEAVVDLFETPENIPTEVQVVLEKYSDTTDYRELEKCLAELEPLGYTFDYYLDGVPYDLRKTNEKMRKGGLIKDQYAGKSPEYVWNKWTGKQRAHFFADHEKVIGYNGNIHAFTAEDYEDLPEIVKTAITHHVNEGQYKDGGGVKPTKAQKKKVAKVMKEFKEGELTSHGETVVDKTQAIAIALSEADLSNKK